jgi:hypothetical protein
MPPQQLTADSINQQSDKQHHEWANLVNLNKIKTLPQQHRADSTHQNLKEETSAMQSLSIFDKHINKAQNAQQATATCRDCHLRVKRKSFFRRDEQSLTKDFWRKLERHAINVSIVEDDDHLTEKSGDDPAF